MVSFDNVLGVDIGETLLEADGHVPRRKRKRDRADVMHPMVAAWATAWIFADNGATGSRERVFSPAKEGAVDAVLDSLAASKKHMERYMSEFAAGGEDKSATYSMWFLSAAMELHAKTLIHRFSENLCSVTDWDALVSHDKDDQQLSVLSGHLGEIDASVSWCVTEALPLLRVTSATSSGEGNVVTAARAAVAAILSGAADTFQLGLASHAAMCANDPESSAAWEGVLSLCSKIVDGILYELHTVAKSKSSGTGDLNAWMLTLTNVTCKLLLCAWRAAPQGSKRRDVEALIRSWLSRMQWKDYCGDLHAFVSSMLSHALKARSTDIVDSVIVPIVMSSVTTVEDLTIDTVPDFVTSILESVMKTSSAAEMLFLSLHAKIVSAHATDDSATLKSTLIILSAAAAAAPRRARGRILPQGESRLRDFYATLQRPQSTLGMKPRDEIAAQAEATEVSELIDLTIKRLRAQSISG